jgi:hypothetical protein
MRPARHHQGRQPCVQVNAGASSPAGLGYRMSPQRRAQSHTHVAPLEHTQSSSAGPDAMPPLWPWYRYAFTQCLFKAFGKKEKKKKEEKQTGFNHTQKRIGRGRQPAGRVEGEQWEGRWSRKGEKRLGAGEELHHHHNTKAEQYGVGLLGKHPDTGAETRLCIGKNDDTVKALGLIPHARSKLQVAILKVSLFC